LEVKLQPDNVLVWHFFWAMDALGYDYACSHYKPLLHFSEWECGAFFERLWILKRKVESLRIEKLKKD